MRSSTLRRHLGKAPTVVIIDDIRPRGEGSRVRRATSKSSSSSLTSEGSSARVQSVTMGVSAVWGRFLSVLRTHCHLGYSGHVCNTTPQATMTR